MSDAVSASARQIQGVQDTPQNRFRVMISVITLAAVILVLAQGNGIWRHSGAMILTYATGKIVLLAFVIVVHMTAFRLRHADDMVWYIAYFRRMPATDIVLSYAALTITLSCFTIYKSQVVGATGYSFDALFARWDVAIFGRAPWELTHAVWQSSGVTVVVNALYHQLFLPMLAGYVVAMVAQIRPALRYTYICTYLAGYVVIGMVFAQLLPSAGPVYDGTLYGNGATFGPLIAQLAAQQPETPMMFAQLQDYLLALQKSGQTDFGGGISAMPSMHVVLVFLWSIAAWHLNRWAGIAMSLYSLLIWAGSVHLGWHYFVDGLVGIALIAPIWLLMGWYFKLYGPRNARAVR